MKNAKEYKISIWLLSISLVLFCISFVTGLIPGLVFAIDKICMGLGFSVYCFGLMFLENSKDNNNKTTF